MARIAYNYGNHVIDGFIQRYKEVSTTKKKNNDMY